MPKPMDLPENVERLIRSASTAEFSTMTAAGAPLDTPLLCFAAEDLSNIQMTTGVAYPAKAERVRRNPKVGLLIEGVLPGEPVISIAGMAATKDADIEANALRYIAETGHYGAAAGGEWSDQRKAIWYWARLIMVIVPKQVLWWDGPDALDKEPHRWDAPAGTVFPISDPAPTASPETAAPKWDQPPWTQLASEALGRNAPGHLSLVDEDGFPRPTQARNLRSTDDGFALDIPASVPGRREGKASLSFQGRENFIGRLAPDGASLRLKVERALPILPLMNGPSELWTPQASTYDALMGRLEAELGRRGQALPILPETRPAATPGALRRAEREAAIARLSA
jgi:hypothetical protein